MSSAERQGIAPSSPAAPRRGAARWLLVLAALAIAALLVLLDRREADAAAREQLRAWTSRLPPTIAAPEGVDDLADRAHPEALATARRARGYDATRYLTRALDLMRAGAEEERRPELAQALDRLRGQVLLERPGPR